MLRENQLVQKLTRERVGRGRQRRKSSKATTKLHFFHFYERNHDQKKKKNAPRNSVLTNDSCFKVHQSNSLAHCRHYSNRCHVSCTLLSLYRYRMPLNPLSTTLAYTTACLLSIRPSQHIITDDIAFKHNALHKLNSVYHSTTQKCNFAYSLTWL
jgi:hypothetical protein